MKSKSPNSSSFDRIANARGVNRPHMKKVKHTSWKNSRLVRDYKKMVARDVGDDGAGESEKVAARYYSDGGGMSSGGGGDEQQQGGTPSAPPGRPREPRRTRPSRSLRRPTTLTCWRPIWRASRCSALDPWTTCSR